MTESSSFHLISTRCFVESLAEVSRRVVSGRVRTVSRRGEGRVLTCAERLLPAPSVYAPTANKATTPKRARLTRVPASLSADRSRRCPRPLVCRRVLRVALRGTPGPFAICELRDENAHL